MFSPFLNREQNILLAAATFFIVVSFAFLLLRKYRLAVIFLMLGAVPLKFFFISIDRYLNYWDECFHALVAKNMMEHPFKPMLYANALLPYDPFYWCGNHIWLHKQPLSLWQSALSMKLLGVSEIKYRIPSLALSVLIIPIIFRMGKLIQSEITGYFAALIFTLGFYINSLTTGYYMSAENDLIFLIYITASCWAYLEYTKSKNPHWIYLIGLFSGLAILTKWLVGLLVYSGWFVNLLLEYKKEKSNALKKIIPFLKSLAITFIIFLPWTIYTLIAFPEEAKHELSLNSRHFYEVIEGHSGTWMYHFEKMKDFYTPLDYNWVFGIIILGLLLIKDRGLKITMALFVLLPLVFYTIAKTKMPSFTIVVFVFVALLFSGILDRVVELIKRKTGNAVATIVLTLLFVIISYHVFDLNRVLIEHSDKNLGHGYRLERMHNKPEYFAIRSKIETPVDKAVLFNVTFPYNIDMMFYTDVLTYAYLPNEPQIEELMHKGYQLYALDNNLPDHLKADLRLKKITADLQFNYSNW